tara:strand:- start:7390 stop:8679 length:1290 start_codon:yes stop_codon:yes gene_type:complete
MLQTKSKILLVDDYPALVTLTRHKLLQKGYEVITAQNGQDALELVRTEYPDLVLSDVEMPIMNGYELCSKIKNDSRLCQIPVILVTSMVTTDYLMNGIASGADNYLTKPYDDDTLFTKVEELLGSIIQPHHEKDEIAVTIENRTYNVRADYSHLINLFVSTYKNTLAQNAQLEKVKQELNSINKDLEYAKNEHEDLIQNVFPHKIADSLLAYGTVSPERYDDVTIMFTDFDGFSKVVPTLTPEELIESLSFYFDEFDNYADQHNLIKIKTIGDSYMAAGGLPERTETHPIDTVLTALKMQHFISRLEERASSSIPFFPLRIGIHTGPAVVGVIGKRRFAYDIWGNTVNLAARMEQHSDHNAINISEATYLRVKDFFVCESRGEIEARNIGKVPMYYVKRIKEEFSEDEDGLFPNRLFVRSYNMLSKKQF